jgi:P27 family predicted phage terminase small subunit
MLAWWRHVMATYVLEQHHVHLLQLACEAFDEAQQARAVLAKEGMTVANASGGIRSHPAIAVERDARLAFARLVRELDLDSEPPIANRVAPPALFSNSRRARRRGSQVS